MIKVVQLDVDSKTSVEAAAQTIASDLGQEKLYAIVNNAGIGKGNINDVLRTNIYGVKLMCDAFIPLIDPSVGRIVNMSSGTAPGYVKRLSNKETINFFLKTDVTWEEIDDYLK